MADEQRNDRAYVQGFLDRGERIPPGEYLFRGDLTVPDGYPFGILQTGVKLAGPPRRDLATIRLADR